jgi:hypothetical protein
MIQTGRRTTFNLHRLSEGKKHEQKFCPTQIIYIYICKKNENIQCGKASISSDSTSYIY